MLKQLGWHGLAVSGFQHEFSLPDQAPDSNGT